MTAILMADGPVIHLHDVTGDSWDVLGALGPVRELANCRTVAGSIASSGSCIFLVMLQEALFARILRKYVVRRVGLC